MSHKKLNILFLSGWYPNRVIPTDGNFVQKYAEAVALQSNVIAMHVCVDNNCESNIEIVKEKLNGVDTVNVYYKKPNHRLPLVSKIQKTFRQVKAYNAGLKKVFEKYPSIDIVHVNILFPAGLFAWYLKRRKKIPYVITEHHTIYIPTNQATPGVTQKYLSKIIARNASYILPVTENLRDAMISFGLETKYEIIGNVVDTNLFFPAPASHTHGKIKFLHVSSLKDSQKNLSGMLRVVAQLAKQKNNFEFWMIGDGDLTPHIKLAEELGINNQFVFFDGTKTTKEVAELMRTADCMVLFSHYENFPCVIVEAMASGIPTISTDVGGIAEHLTPNHGILINANDEAGLLNALKLMMESIRNKKYNTKELRQYAEEHFSYQKVSEKFHSVYHQILKKDG